MLSICPILSAAPRTLQSVLTILSALASDSNGESNRAFVSAKQMSSVNSNEAQQPTTVTMRQTFIIFHRTAANSEKVIQRLIFKIKVLIVEAKLMPQVHTSFLFATQRLLCHLSNGANAKSYSQPCGTRRNTISFPIN